MTPKRIAEEKEPATPLGKRLKEARLYAGARASKSMTQPRMAEAMTEQLGRKLHLNQWRRYELGETEAPLEIITAAARLSGLSEAYIAFGIRTEDVVNPARDRRLTEEEEERATAQADSDRKAAARSASGRGRQS